MLSATIIFGEDDHKTESHRPLIHDASWPTDWVVASWELTSEPGELVVLNRHSNFWPQRARLKPSQKECGHKRSDADLTGDKQTHGNWIAFSKRCAYPALEKSRFGNLIKLDSMTTVNSDKNILHIGLPASLKFTMPLKR